MSISKYIGESDSATHGGPLSWGSGSDFPFRGPVPYLKEAELDDVQVVQDFHSREFDLTVEADQIEYHRVMDRVVNQWYVCYYREVFRDPTTGARKVYVEWTQRYGQYVPGANRGSAVLRTG